jgi:phytoene synthase
MRDPSYAIYAFCRLSDDLVDLDGGQRGAISRLRARLDAAYDGRPFDHPVDRAFADTVRRFGVPRALPAALLDGLDWDVDGQTYETLDDVFAYAARVAGSVGAIMAVLMDARSEETLARACDLGVAMQLTNIARDVGEDARNGRLYLPRQWMRQEGIDPDLFLSEPRMSVPLGRVIERLLQAANELYLRADGGIVGLPPSCRPAITAARNLYHAIGEGVARNGFDSVSVRARVGASQKLQLAARAWLQAPVAPDSSQSLPQTRFLVDSVLQSPVPQRGPQSFAERIVWVAELFASLSARESVGA